MDWSRKDLSFLARYHSHRFFINLPTKRSPFHLHSLVATKSHNLLKLIHCKMMITILKGFLHSLCKSILINLKMNKKVVQIVIILHSAKHHTKAIVLVSL